MTELARCGGRGRRPTAGGRPLPPAFRAVLALALALALALGGCLGPAIDFEPMSARIEGREEVSYVWRDAVAFTASGASVPLPTSMARGIEQLVDGIGAEPNLGVTSSGAIFVTTFDQVRRSVDQGRTWEVVWDFKPAGNTTEDLFSTSDPMLWVDPDTDRVFVNQMHPGLQCTYMAWSDDEGETWMERPLACGGLPGIDHQKVMTAKPRLAAPTAQYPNVVYVCNNKRLDLNGFLGAGLLPPTGMGTSCYMSRDGGLTYPVETEAYVNDQLCSNINGHPAAYPDGTVAMVLGNLGRKCDRPFTVVLSEDDGTTWSTRQCDPELGQVEIDADMTVTPDGTAYVLLRNRDEIAWLARSTDKWQTCDAWRVSPPDHTLNVFAGITSGDDGRVAMAYLGTRDPQALGAEPSNATPGSHWHAFVTTVFDAASPDPTFVTQQVTPGQDPVQVGCVWLGGGGGGPYQCRNLLDFIDMVHDAEGRWYVAITDGCTPRGGCTGAPDEIDFQSRDRQIGVIVQDSGLSLFSSVGELPSLGLTPPVPLPR